MPSRETHARKSYERDALDEHGIASDPFHQFTTWYDEAVAAGLPEPEAMTLSTATLEGRPSARIVLLRGYDERGFCFFSNYASQKGRELAANPHAAVTFHWVELERQVRIVGRVDKLSASESDAYFQSRPSQSRIGAWSSPQSEVIASRDTLEQLVKEYQEKYSDESAIPRPEHWGGYRVIPERIEFWQGRPSRLHDRLRFSRIEQEAWTLERLAP
ncbi:pyridoxamine 5'-phosphate oxidase [Pirellulales bacterium]|jgi:pyridoxamine 5'-phosphate oxidase|nr:pyridoxamine 5'-phosphate oxidase [Pirellulales bacterium]